MGDGGLQKSIWAPRGSETTSFRRPGDWDCPSCGVLNFQSRTQCFRCSFVPSVGGTAANGPAVADGNQRTHSTGLGDHNVIPLTLLDTTPADVPQIQYLRGGERGLSTSRWAPRNYAGRPHTNGEVWTRTVQIKPPAASQTTKPPDLGLPYEVQHYILAMIQRILEEACYDFATRWIPQKLAEKGWDCPEIVELSTWKTFLPTAIPARAIVPVMGYSLEAGLLDAVKTRNAAVHRHLCDNAEIRKMAKQGQNLMMIFSDVTRQDKFHRLWMELNNWDASQDDDYGKKKRLQQALIEISERPMDDMDWTPNDLSLQEITGEVVEGSKEVYVDEMELD